MDRSAEDLVPRMQAVFGGRSEFLPGTDGCCGEAATDCCVPGDPTCCAD